MFYVTDFTGEKFPPRISKRRSGGDLENFDPPKEASLATGAGLSTMINSR